MKMNRKTTLIFIINIIFLLFLVFIALYLIVLHKEQGIPEGIYVSEVIDGDTFKMSDNETVRLLCIDAPEKGKKGYEDAKQFLQHLIFLKNVRLEKDITDRDEYGRLLRYVYVNISDSEVFVNKEMVRLGYAKLFPYPPDTKRCEEIGG